jgi:hypothetical protein
MGDGRGTRELRTDGRCLRSEMGTGAEGAAYIAVGSKGPQASGDVGRGERTLLLRRCDSIYVRGHDGCVKRSHVQTQA